MSNGKVKITRNGITQKHISGGSASDKEEGQLSLDIYQNKDEIIVVAPIAGIEQKDIQISVTDEVLLIRGKRKFPLEEVLDECFSKECFWGDFSRSIVLPENVDTSNIDANFHNAVLTLRIPKIEKVKTKIINIKS